LNLDLRNGLYALFRVSFEGGPSDAFHWLAAFLEECRKAGTAGVSLKALSEAGRLKGLPEPGLPVLCSGPLLFLRAGEVQFRFASSDRPYLEDRVPRFLRVLSAFRAPQTDLDEIRIGQDLFNAGLFYDCHEYLEELWRKSDGGLKRLVQGLIQAGAGFHKFELGSPSGAAGLLRQAAEKLCVDPRLPGLDPGPFARRLSESADALERGSFRLEQAPTMSVLTA
jgi:hypothetical protein